MDAELLPPSGGQVVPFPQSNRLAGRDWHDKLRRDYRGQLIADEANVGIALACDPTLATMARYNEFSAQVLVMRRIPGRIEPPDSPQVERPWSDTDTIALQDYLQRTIFPRVARATVDAAVMLYAHREMPFHPIRQYLDGLAWDGSERLGTWLPDYLGGDQQPADYLHAVGRAYLISAVARIYNPGCQVDHALVLEGRQGTGKTSALRVLAGTKYFSDSLPADLASKDARDHLRGKWFIELPELAQFKKSEVETIKAFISRCEERFRPPYERHEIDWPRQCVFAGTTNDCEYLIDTTGNRRFWPVLTGAIRLEPLRADRDQLWAEAVRLYRAGAKWHLADYDTKTIAAQEAAKRVAIHPWTADIARVTSGLVDVTPGEAMRLIDVPIEEQGRHSQRVGAILTELGWRRGLRHRTRGQIFTRDDVKTVK